MSYIGEAEVAAWVILGHIWHLFDAVTYGSGDAAEILVALHLGEGRADLAKLSAYKSLWLGMLGSGLVFSVFVLIMPSVPSLFTPNEVLQELIGSALPLIAIGYLALAFGYLCWYIVGATGRYKIGNYVHFIVSLGVTLPIALILVRVFTFDVQGLAAAVVLGYVTVGGCLSFVLFTTNWNAQAELMESDAEDNEHEDEMTDYSEEDLKEEILKKKRVTFANRDNVHLIRRTSHNDTMTTLAMQKSRRAKSIAFKNTLMITVKAGPLGITIASRGPNLTSGTVITGVSPTSPLYKRVVEGDKIVAIDGFSVDQAPAPLVSKMLELSENYKKRRITVLTTRKRFRMEDLGDSCRVCACYDMDADNDDDDQIEMDYVRYGQTV